MSDCRTSARQVVAGIPDFLTSVPVTITITMTMVVGTTGKAAIPVTGMGMQVALGMAAVTRATRRRANLPAAISGITR